MYKKSLAIISVLLMLAAAGSAQNDIRIKKMSKIKMPGMEMSEKDLSQLPPQAQERMKKAMNRESTVYIKGPRMRTDMAFEKPGKMKMKKVMQTMINQCDRKRMFSFDDDKKKYTVTNYGDVQTAKAAAKSDKPGKNMSRGLVHISVTGIDAGERMTLFGYNARRMKQTITMTPSGSSCMKSPMTIESDGWYADVPTFACALKSDVTTTQSDGASCTDEVSYEIKGVAVTGVPLKEIRTMTTDGNTIVVDEEVIELVNTPLSAALFEPPPDYTAADGSTDVGGGFVNEAPAAPPEPPASSSLAPPMAGVPPGQLATEKKTGVIRIGIAAPLAEMGDAWEGGDTSAAVRNTLAVALKTDNVETVILDSGLAEMEAKQKQCDYIFYSKVTRKKGGGMFGGMLAPMIVGAAAGMIPGVGGIVASVATSVIMTTTISGGFKSKDEVGFEYRVVGTDGATLIPATQGKLKAKKNGDDVLTPQLQQAATATLAKAVKPQS